ncbi:hypothetical protein EPO17_00090 [Patescibacteria group bacterium]|nr:MAG: hypothetical protein EPO17_00090 [Patescibacteria group bacterium]
MRIAKLFFALVLFGFGLTFIMPATFAQTAGQGETVFLAHFDYHLGEANDRISGVSYYAPSGFQTAIPVIDPRGKFGPGSIFFNNDGKYHSLIYYLKSGQEISFGDGEFTVDFWIKPLESYNAGAWYTFFNINDGLTYNGGYNRYIQLWRKVRSKNADGSDWLGLKPEYQFEGLRTYLDHRENDAPTDLTTNAPVDRDFYARRTKAFAIPQGDLELTVLQWNHVAIQKKNVGNQPYINIAVNGKAGKWIPYIAAPATGTVFNKVEIGDLFYYSGAPAFHGLIDEFRITKGKALWRDVPDNGTFAVPTAGDYSNTVVDQNKILTPVAESIDAHVISLGNTVEVSNSTDTTRPSIREEYLTKLDGTPKLTSYLDANNKLVTTIYWAGNATTSESKKIKRFEYDADGQIAREIYYGIDGANITDVVTYYSKSAGGALQKEIKNRNGTEYYKRYSASGRLLYEHEYKDGQYVVSRNFIYDGVGRLASELVFSSPSKYEKIVYSRNGSGVVTQTDSYKAYTPTGTDTANYVHTTSTYTGTVVTGITRTYFNKDTGTPTALRTEIARYNTSGVAVDQRTFDYAQNKQKFSTFITTTGSKSLGRLKTDEEWSLTDYSYASSSLAYNGTTGDLISWSKVNYDDMSAQGARAGYYWTKYTIYNVKTGLPKEEWFYARWPSLNTKRIDSVIYDDKGVISYRKAWDYRDAYGVYAHTVTKYTKDSLIQLLAKYEDTTGLAVYAEVYYGNGEVWYLYKYQNGPSADQYTVNYFRVNQRNGLSTSTASDLVADGTKIYTKSGAFVSESVPSDPLSQEKIGEKILANIPDSSLRSQAQTGAEKVAILAVLKTLLPDYKNALLAVSESDPLKKEKRYEIYVAYAWKITRAIYAIEYRFNSGSPKYLNTDNTLDKAITAWYGIDGSDLSGNTEFWGLYIRPGAINSADADAVYVDMDILNPSAVDFAINASSYSSLTNTPKKIEKWDALRLGAGFSFANNTLSLFNLSGGVGRYITLDEMTKADPTVNLTLDRFEEDMKNSGVILSSLSETQVIEKMYQYFDKQSYFNYLYDLSQVAQTVNQTLVRKGGDCEDFGLFFLSLLRGEFTRLGNTDAVSRLGLVTAYVDSNAPISVSNQGAGHASVGFRQGSTYYYIEASYLFLGSGADVTRPTPQTLNVLSSSGSTVSGTIGQSGWYVQVADMYPLGGSRVPFSGSLGVFHDTINQTNSVDTTVAQVSSIYTKLEPYNPLVTTLASSTVQTIPNFKNQTIDFVVESTHSFFNRLVQYVPESSGADVWRGVDQTIPAVINPDGTVNLSAKISGDCEDLAFAEASLLENVLLRYYIAGGAVPENAVNQAKKNVIVIAEKDYGGVAGRSHLYLGFLTPKTDTSPAVVRLIDPQQGTIGTPMLMSDLYNDKYLFFADREKVSAITPYDWSSLNFSAAVKAAAAMGIVLNPGPVDPNAPARQNLTPQQQAEIINAVVTADPPKPSAVRQFLNFVYEKSGAKAIVESSTILEALVRVAVKAALLIGGGPIGTAVQFAVSAINMAAVGLDHPAPIPTPEEAGVKVVNGIVTVVGALTKPGGADSPERAEAEAALRAGRTVPATPANMDSNNSSATEAAATTRQSGQVIVQRNNSTSVVNAIGPNDTSRTTTTKVYNPVTNVMTITTQTTIVIPQSPIIFYRSPAVTPQICPVGTPVCTGSEGVSVPANARADGSPSSCYISGQAPSCETRQYATAWVCENFYDKDTAGTGCACIDPLASNVGQTATCQYGATVSCAGGNLPPANSVAGVSSFPAPTGQTSSSTIAWDYLLGATPDNTQCKWSCANGYKKDGALCVPDEVFSCSTLSVPEQARLCASDDQGLTSNTDSTFVSSCSSPDGSAPKCQYACSFGFSKVGSACQCLSPRVVQGGSCVDNTTSSAVILSAVPSSKGTGGTTVYTAPLASSISVKKGQLFKLAWSQNVSGSADTLSGSCSSGSSNNDPNWVTTGLPLSGEAPDLKLTQAGTYTYYATCQYGTSLTVSTSQVTVRVEPTGVFEEF